ncbi:MAG: tripartite tricarboxylate transporter TctB family protein [Lachnospiraceae bacterium]|nr:tripartite tricarboxylate transporter TctB family protein [Lachnospiraceae bacterium]
MKDWINNLDAKIDSMGEKLSKKNITIPTDLVTAAVFMILGIVLLLCVPSQVTVGKNEVVSGAEFPTYLCYLMIGGSIIIAVQNILKIVRKEPIETKVVNALVEVKALIIFGILVMFWVICNVTDLFVLGAIFCAVSFLIFFRCKKVSYYIITIAFAIGIWAAFRFGLNVRF